MNPVLGDYRDFFQLHEGRRFDGICHAGQGHPA